MTCVRVGLRTRCYVTRMTLPELVQSVIDTHHAFVRTEIERLGPLLRKVVSAHSAGHPELADVARLFEDLVNDLAPHLMKEERVLFPLVVAMSRAAERGQRPASGLDGPLHVMAIEHDDVNRLLLELRKVTNGYAIPVDACESYRVLYAGLRAFDDDLVRHLDVENNVIFPRARALADGAVH